MTSPVSLLRQLIRIDSTNSAPLCDGAACRVGAEREMARFVADWLDQRGFGVEIQEVAPTRPSIIARRSGRDGGGPTLAFEAHLDTVGVEGMDSPFDPHLADGRIYGRGAVDAKGSLAAMLVALERLAEENLPLNLVFIGACAEETGCEGIARLSMGSWPEMAVVGEPTSNRPVAAHKGFVWFDVAVEGETGHSSDPGSGQNAIMRACQLIDFLHRWADENLADLSDADFEASTLSVNRIRGGSRVNASPSQCTFSVDIRLIPKARGEGVLEEIRETLAEEFGFPVELDRIRIAPGLRRVDNGRIAGLLARAAGRCESPGAVHYCSDAGVLQQHGVDCAVFGPGSIREAHGNTEWIETEELERAVDILCEAAELTVR